MIISKTNFRVSLFGGSTDYEEYYSKHGSLLIGFGLNKYCYCSVRDTPSILDYTTKISYRITEIVSDNSKIENNAVRGVLEYLGINHGVEISYVSDLPSQTGIGSSSSFIVGLLAAFSGGNATCRELADDAIHIERKLLNEPGGIQDQIWAAYGGFNAININKDGTYNAMPLGMSKDFIDDFFARSVLIYTGNSRNSFEIASSHTNNKEKIQELAHIAYDNFIDEDLVGVAVNLRSAWEEKQKLSPLISSPIVNEIYSILTKHGMIGGKLLGSGGSGFIFGIMNSLSNKQAVMSLFKDRYVECGLSNTGTEIIWQS